jgi:hypothetical protein
MKGYKAGYQGTLLKLSVIPVTTCCESGDVLPGREYFCFRVDFSADQERKIPGNPELPEVFPARARICKPF